MAARLGTRSYVAERAERGDAATQQGTTVYDDGRIVVNVNCGGSNCAAGVGGGLGGLGGYGAYGALGGLGAVVPSLPGLWPLPPLSAGAWGALPPGFIYGAPCYGAPPMLLPPLTSWSPYVANPGSFCS